MAPLWVIILLSVLGVAGIIGNVVIHTLHRRFWQKVAKGEIVIIDTDRK